MRVDSLDTLAEDRHGYSWKFSFRKVGVGYWESLRWQLGKSAAGMPATMLSVRNIVINRSVMAFRPSLFPHLYSEGRGLLLRGVTGLCVSARLQAQRRV